MLSYVTIATDNGVKAVEALASVFPPDKVQKVADLAAKYNELKAKRSDQNVDSESIQVSSEIAAEMAKLDSEWQAHLKEKCAARKKGGRPPRTRDFGRRPGCHQGPGNSESVAERGSKSEERSNASFSNEPYVIHGCGAGNCRQGGSAASEFLHNCSWDCKADRRRGEGSACAGPLAG